MVPHLRFALSSKRGSVSSLPVAESSAGSQLIPQVIQFTNFANTIPLGCFLQLTAPAQQQPHARQEAKTSAKSTGVAAANKEMAELEVRDERIATKTRAGCFVLLFFCFGQLLSLLWCSGVD